MMMMMNEDEKARLEAAEKVVMAMSGILSLLLTKGIVENHGHRVPHTACTVCRVVNDAVNSLQNYDDVNHGRVGITAVVAEEPPITWKDYNYCPSCFTRDIRGEECIECKCHLPARKGEPGYGRFA